MKGINLGVGVPGTAPGQLALSRDQYRRWLERMGEIGVNTLRVYTLHFPRFYEEFLAYNLRNPEMPLFLLQGIWLDEDNPSHDFFDMTAAYDREIENVINALHGDAEVEFSFGKAFGTYTTDVSAWTLGWVVGREIGPDEVEITNANHPEMTAYAGQSLSLPAGMPMEVWLAQRLDRVVTFERQRYGATRPVSFSSWPTLDPLVHPIEGDNSDEDRINLDLGNLDLHDAPGGFFIIFHAYPYYPDFIVETPEYADTLDDVGRNSYLGYLQELVAHYGDIPVVIGEFGTPSSWGSAHYALNGMHHGGLDETTTGHFGARLLRNVFDSGCAGGVYFSWMDEWWKRTWITDELDFPRNRRLYWHNVTAAEQNFGLLAFDVGPPTFEQFEPVLASGPIERLEVDADAAYFHVRLSLRDPLTTDDELIVGFDTYRDDLGESRLPNGQATERRLEFALVVSGLDRAHLYVMAAYDTYGIWHGTSENHQHFHSVASDGGDWSPIRWKSNGRHASSTGAHHFPETSQAIGELRLRRSVERATSMDAVVLADTGIDIRIPWTLLQFNDPSQRSVLDDDRLTPGRETAISEGIALSVWLGEQLIETDRFAWPTWDEAPPTVEREKPSLELFSQGLQALPGNLPSDMFEELPEDPNFELPAL